MNSTQRHHLATAMILLAGGMPYALSGGGGDDPTRKERPCLNCGETEDPQQRLLLRRLQPGIPGEET